MSNGETITCPLTGLQAEFSKDDHMSVVKLKHLNVTYTSNTGSTNEYLLLQTQLFFDKLIQNDPIKKGKLLRWLSINSPVTIIALHPEMIPPSSNYYNHSKEESTFIKDVQSSLEEKITPVQKLGAVFK